VPLFRSLFKLFAFLVRYTRHIRRAHLMGIGVLVAAVLSGIANTALIALVNHVINAGPGERASLLLPFLGICVAFPALRYAGDWLLIYLTEKATLHLRLTLCTRMLAVPLRTLEEVGAARLNGTLMNDLPTVIGAMALIPLLCLNFTIVAGCLVYMGFLSWPMLLGVLVFLVAGVAAYQLPLVRGHGHIVAHRELSDRLFGHFRSLVEGVKELKLHHRRRQAFLDEQLQGTAVEVQRHAVAAQRAFSSAVSWGQVLIFLLIGVVAFGMPYFFASVDRPVLTGFTFAILYMVGPIQTALNQVAPLSRAMASMDRVEKIGVELQEAARGRPRLLASSSAAAPTAAPADAAAGAPVETDGELREWRSLRLEGVTHSYRSERDGSQFTLGPLDLDFRPGEVVFVTGGNGSGKTTFAKLLTGLYAPESGRLVLDGHTVEPGSDRYASLFSCVFSDFHLFDSLLGLQRDELDAEAREYLEELQLDHKVTVEGGRLSTTTLSQGQRKRLALLTAYLEDRPIYLFDEWAADQDPHFKEVFYHRLLPRLRERGKTVFAISHDDRYYGVADRLIRLDYGRVARDSRPGEAPAELELAAAAG
jgi:putative ATP-binding cassette transporter